MIPVEIALPDDVTDAELVVDRRGSRIWKITLANGKTLALKYATDNASAQGVQAASARQLAAREANVLRNIDNNGYLYASGETDHGTWIALSWLDAPTISQRWKGVRTNDDPQDRTSAVVATWLAAVALAQLHTSGWRHADLQADHVRIPDTGPAHLIDFALAQGPVEVKPTIAYRGAIAHLTAPEIAAEFLATPSDHHVNLTAAAEVYTFGAVLFAAWTKQWLHEYDIDPRELTVQNIHARICETRSRRPLPEGWPQMSALIAAATEPDPAKRPTITEISAALSEQMMQRQ